MMHFTHPDPPYGTVAYSLMSRCWGALMLLVYVAFYLEGERQAISEEQRWLERWRFRQLHFPQLYLAGLPLDFLGVPQLRWVFPALQRLWANEIIDPECYDTVTDRLGYLGEVARERRKADRERKSAPPEVHGGTAAAGGRPLEDILLVPDPTDPGKELDHSLLGERLAGMLRSLEPDEREVTELYFGFGGRPKRTPEEIARDCEMTPEHVRSTVTRSLEKLRRSPLSQGLMPFAEMV